MLAYVGRIHNIKDLNRKDARLYCGSRLRSGEVFAYVGSIQNLKDLKDRKSLRSGVRLCWELEEPKEPKEQSHPLSPLHEPLHGRAKRDPKAKKLYLQSFLRKCVSLAMLGEIKTHRT